MDELNLLRKKVVDLERDNRLFMKMEETGRIGGWQFDPATLKQTWTDEVFRILEIDMEHGAPEVPKGLEFIDPEFRPMAEKAIQLAMGYGEPYNQEWMVTTSTGNKKWVNAVCNPKMENGQLISISGSFQDITDRKNAEEQLKALNQQLVANEQQLKAANQQLQANEQQLRAAVQQLQAGEQQLLASNQELKASELQLKEAHIKIKESEQQFRQLFENMEQGFAVHEMIYDENNNPIDYRFLLINDAFEKLTGIVASDYIGKTVKQVLPEIEQVWIENYGKVAKTAKPLQFEHYSKYFDKYYNVTAYSPKKGLFATVFTDTTQDRLIREQILEAKEQVEKDSERYLGLINNLDSGIVIHAADTSILNNNQRAAELLGLSEDQLKGKVAIDPQWQFIYEDKSPLPFNDYPVMRILTTKKPMKNQVLGVIRKADDIVWLMVNGIPVIDSNKEISEIIISFTDITRRKQTETKLIAAKELAERNEIELTKVQEITHVGSWYLNISTNEVVWSKELYNMYGFDPTKPVPPYTEHMKLFTPESWDILSASLAETSEKGIPYELELRTVRNDKSIGWMWVRGEALYDENKKIVGLWGAAQDISERKNLEIELKTAKEKAEKNELQLNAILENSPTGFAINKISTGEVTYVNKAFTDAYHIPLELCSKVSTFFEYVYGDQMDLGNKILSDVMSEDPKRMKWNLVPIIDKKTKGNHYVAASNIFLKELDLMISTVTDITSQVNNESELIKAKEKAEESDRLKSAFLANMSHEIRTPMNGILGFTSLLLEPSLTGEEQQEYIEIIQKSGNRMLNTVNDIIDISRIESGLVELSVSEVNIIDQLKELHTFFKPEAAKKGTHLIFKNDASEQDFIIKTDLQKFNSIVTNLIKNAIKFTNQGFIELGYNIKKENGSAELDFYVKDSGIGIPKDRQNAIFERFVQADIEDKKAHQGSGLGLAISKAYAEMLGGKVWVESEEGKGSTFYFTIECKTESESKSITKDDGQLLNEDNISEKLNILVIEDDKTSQDLISIIVDKLAKKIMNVSSGLEAIEVCRKNPDIDLILMDIQLPDLNGYEATRQIREFNKDVVILAQTAYALAGDKEKAINIGCNDYISKPINKTELLSLIQKYFNN
jgi:PAS domain S-box-containing protein